MYIFGKVRELSELIGIDSLENRSRSRVKVLCIDDQGMQYDDILRKHGFNIRVLEDIEDIGAVSDYPVVICDIMGIGKGFGSEYEGGHIIEEIRRKYPAKVVIAHTGQQFDARFNRFFDMCDFVLTKDIDSDQWVSVLDKSINKLLCPLEQWKKLRAFLFNKEVSTRKVFELEQEYIIAITTKDKSKFASAKTIDGLAQDVRGVLQGFIVSILFAAVSG